MRDAWPLLTVLGLIAAAALVVRRFMPARRMLTGQGVLDVVARASLSGKQSLLLVKMGRRLVLLGVSPERINALAEVEEREEVALLLGEVASTGPDSMSRVFAGSMAKERGAFLPDPLDRESAAEASRHVRGLLEKVRGRRSTRHVA
jgi:flagellar biosynthetic protein FliO